MRLQDTLISPQFKNLNFVKQIMNQHVDRRRTPEKAYRTTTDLDVLRAGLANKNTMQHDPHRRPHNTQLPWIVEAARDRVPAQRRHHPESAAARFGRPAPSAYTEDSAGCADASNRMAAGLNAGPSTPLRSAQRMTVWGGGTKYQTDLEQCDGTGMRYLRERPAVRQ
jgi:hypothetical protein